MTMSKKNKLFCFASPQAKPLAVAISLMTAMSLVSCGSGNQDKGNANNHSQNFSGVVVDGHVSRATVFIDSNNNGTRDPWEPKAFTDDEGYYSYNPNSGTNYCAGDASAEEQQYCLATSLEYDSIVIRVDGGYDRLTGEPFLGQMSRRVDTDDASATTMTVISPLTTLVTSLPNATDQERILTNIGLSQSDLNIDYLNASGNGEVDSVLLNAAIKIHKTVTVLSDRIDDNYPELNDTVGLPNTSSDAIYNGLAALLSGGNQSIDAVLTDSNQLLQILDGAEERIREQISSRGMDVPLDMGNIDNPDNFSRVIEIAQQIPPVVNQLLNPVDMTMDQEDVLGNARIIESVVIKATSETDIVDSTIDNALSFILDENNNALVEELSIALREENADLGGVAQNDFVGLDSNEIQEVAQLAEDAVAFSGLAGKSIKVSDLDLGYGPDNLQDIEIEISFLGAEGAVSGSTIACAKYIDEAGIDGTLGEGNFHGEILDGYWSLLGASSAQDGSSYSLLLTFQFLGTTYQAIMKPAGSELIGGQVYQRIRFDNDGEMGIWHSLDGMVDQDALPATSDDCVERLPSRVGLETQ